MEGCAPPRARGGGDVRGAVTGWGGGRALESSRLVSIRLVSRRMAVA